MTSGDNQSRSEHYREVADSLRRLARQTQFPDVRRDLTELADSFERMAEFTQKWATTEREP
jgi:outer membrane protein assembly factor BamD (BamD/ComL family)